MASILEVDIFVDNNTVTEQVCQLLKTLRPCWKDGDVQVTELSGGLFNVVYMISRTTDPGDPDDRIAMKVFSPASNKLVDQKAAADIITFLSNNSDFLQVYCRFQNGYMYKFYPGRLIRAEELKDDAIMRNMCDNLHRLHSITLPEQLEVEAFGDILQRCTSILNSAARPELEQRLEATGFSREAWGAYGEDTLKMYRELKAIIPLGICHSDTYTNNILIQENTGAIRLIDWDMVGLSLETLDLALLIGRDPVRKLHDAGLLPYQNEAFFDRILRMYLSTHPRYKSQGVTSELLYEWKIRVLRTCEVAVRWDATCVMGMWAGFDEVKFDGPCLGLQMKESAEQFRMMLERMKDAKLY